MVGNTTTMDDNISYDDKRRAKLQLLSQRLDRVNINRIKELANKLISIDKKGMPKP